MNLQIINSIHGVPEFILLPIKLYEQLPDKVRLEWAALKDNAEYVPFVLEDYITNPVALARMKAQVSQEELADAMDVSQSYISQLEVKEKISAKTLSKIYNALKSISES
jgi:predicted XRE-type DNA-binding protein